MGVNGKLIYICGIDGAGKTTLAQNLTNIISKNNKTVLVPSSKNSIFIPELEIVSAKLNKTRQECFSATFRGCVWALELINKSINYIEPALKEYKTVIVDRYTICNRVYTYLNDKESLKIIDKLHSSLPKPDIIIHLDLDWKEAWRRILKRGEPLSPKEKPEKLKEAAELYKKMINDLDVNYIALNSSLPQQTLLDEAIKGIENLLGGVYEYG